MNDVPTAGDNMDAEMGSNQHMEEIKNKDKECQPRNMGGEEAAENGNMELENTELEKHTSAQPRKSKRGRKKKNRTINDGSTDSDSDLFNYDKFLKKVSKKGTRVHMNVRMFAVRTIVPGSKAVLQNNMKMAMNSKEGERVTSTTSNQQQKQKRKIEDVPKPEPQQQSVEDYGDSDNINSPSQRRSNSDYLHAGEDFYNVKGYDIGRYNLRRRTQQKKYYDDELEMNEERDINMKQRKPFGFNDDYKQNYGANPGYNRRAGPPDANFQNKLKRKKKDDDEDYVAEEDEEFEDNDEIRGGNKFNDMRKANGMGNNFHQPNPNQFGYMQPLSNFSSMPGMQSMSTMQTAPNMQPNSSMQSGSNIPWMPGMHNMQSMPNAQWAQNMRPSQNTQSTQNTQNSQSMPNIPNMRSVSNQQWMPNMQPLQGMQNVQSMQNMPQNPNQLAYMMNAQNQRNFQGNFGQNMRGQGMNGMYFQPPNGMMGQGNGQNMNRMYGQPNMQNYNFNR